MNRKALIIILVVGIVLILSVAAILVIRISSHSTTAVSNLTSKLVENQIIIADPYANRENDAIEIVKNLKVLSPDYVDAYAKAKANGKNTAGIERTYMTIEELVNQKLLQNKYNMSFLKEPEWRALHLDTDTGDKQIADAQYEVYLDYKDESVVVGPVWIVDVTTNRVIPRNDIAAVFDRDTDNYQIIDENFQRGENVIKAIVSHKFDNGIDLGGVFLLHFLERINKKGHENDSIIGWTVMHEFKDDYSAYFQWIEKDEIQVAKFKFNWKSKSLTPKGMLAIDLIDIGDNMKTIRSADIYPTSYKNDLNIPRNARWSNVCKNPPQESKAFCNAFSKVLEQQEFITALNWLLTNGKDDGARAIDVCKKNKKCNWDIQPTDNDNIFKISYIYDLNGRSNEIRFLVDSEKETITPDDKISKWAYWSVMPRS